LSGRTNSREYALGSPVKDTAMREDDKLLKVPPMPVLTTKMEGERSADDAGVASEMEGRHLTGWGAIFVCSNACIGAGVLAFPNVFANGGLITTLVLMVLVACLEYLSLAVLVKESQILGVTQFQHIVKKLYGEGMSVFFSCIIFSYMFGALAAYLIIIGDVFTSVAARHMGEGSIYASHSFAIIVVACVVLFPLALKRHFHDLQIVSGISICSLGYLIVAVLIRNFQVMEAKHFHVFEDVRFFPKDFGSLMNAVPVIGFAFVCHLQICEIAREVNPDSTFRLPCFGKKKGARANSDGYVGAATESTGLLGSRMDPVLANLHARVYKVMGGVMTGALCICGVFYGTIGGVSYLAEPNKWAKISDLLEGYGVDDTLMEVGRVALVMNVCCSYPINLGPARSAAMDLMQKLFDNKLNDAILSAVTTIVIVAGSIAVAISVDSLGVVFKIIGGTVGALLIFVLPGLMITGRPSSSGRKCNMNYFGGFSLWVFGAALLICTIVSYFTN